MKTYSTSERTKQALIHAAGELVAERGVGRVSTRAIAEWAGENIGTIHYHFGSKSGLFKEVLLFACHSLEGPSVPEVIRSYEGRLDDVDVQVQAVRAMIRHVVRRTFSPDRPRWFSRVLYQVAQQKGPLQEFLRAQLLDPFFDAVSGLIRRIRPQWTTHEIHVWIYMIIGPVIFHADHLGIVLDRLGSDALPREYLATLEERLVDQALHALGLPTDALQADDARIPSATQHRNN